MNIIVYLRSGSIERFEEQGRSGGSYCNSVKYHEGWCIITDEWGATTAFPSELVKEVKTDAPRRGF